MKKTLLAGGVLLVASLVLIFAFYSYPAATGDSTVFLPVAINLEAGRGLVNGVHDFLYPAPLFPFVLSGLMWEPTPQSAFVALGLLGAGNLVLCTPLFYRAATSEPSSSETPKLTWFSVLLIVLSIAGLATQFDHTEGRPEIFASILLLAGANATLFWPKEWPAAWLWIFYGVLLSLMGATNPNGALLVALLTGIFCAVRYSSEALALKLSCVYGVPLVGIGLLVVARPGSVGAMITTASSVGVQLLGRFSFGSDYSLLTFYIFDPSAFFYGIVFLVALGGGAHLLYRRREQVASPRMLLLFLALFLVLAYLSAIQMPNRRYNLILFAPLFFAANIYYLNHLSAQGFRYASVFQAAYVFLLVLTTAGFVRNVAMFPDYLRHGMSLEEARVAFEKTGVLEKNEKPTVLVTRSMWALTEDYGPLQYCPNLKVCDKKEKAHWLVVQQQHSGRSRPRRTKGKYVLVKDFFVHNKPTFLGLKLGNSMRGYSFALYAKRGAVKGTKEKNFSSSRKTDRAVSTDAYRPSAGSP